MEDSKVKLGEGPKDHITPQLIIFEWSLQDQLCNCIDETKPSTLRTGL